MRTNSALLCAMFVFALVLVSTVASAEIQTLPEVKRGDCVVLSQLEHNSSYNNLTSVTIQGQPKVYLNIAMEKHGYSYNYSYCNTQILGKYIVETCSNLDCSAYEFTVTTSGNDKTIYLSLFMLLGGLIILGIALYSHNEYFGFLSGVLFIVAGIFMMIYGFGDVADMYTRTIAYVSIALGLILEVAAGYSAAAGSGANTSED